MLASFKLFTNQRKGISESRGIMSEWVGKLGTLHQYRDMPYVERATDGSISCMLCGTGWMTYNTRGNHFHGKQHEDKYNGIKHIEIEQKRLIWKYE